MSFGRIKISWPKGAATATLEDTPTARALSAAFSALGTSFASCRCRLTQV